MELRVKEICKIQGITIGELADKMEIKRESLSRAINGNPTLDTIKRIAVALNVDITELFAPKEAVAGIIILDGITHQITSIEQLKSLIE